MNEIVTLIAAWITVLTPVSAVIVALYRYAEWLRVRPATALTLASALVVLL